MFRLIRFSHEKNEKTSIGVCLKIGKTPKPNGFADQTIPMKNGYFIGNINPTFSGPNLVHRARGFPSIRHLGYRRVPSGELTFCYGINGH